MTYLEHESIVSLFNDGLFSVVDQGPILGTVRGVKLSRREKDKKLIFEVTVWPSIEDYPVGNPAGTMILANECIKFFSPIHGNLTATGVFIVKWMSYSNQLIGDYNVQTITIEHIDLHSHSNNKESHLFEWVGNIGKRYILPDLFTSVVTEKSVTNIGEGRDQIIIRDFNKTTHTGRSCLKIIVDGLTIFFVVNSSSDDTQLNKTGYIIYKEDPGRNIREKIRDSLSFTFGLSLHYYGYTSFSKQWHRVHTYAASIDQITDSIYESHPFPPAPIIDDDGIYVDKDKVNTFVKSIYGNYDRIGMREVLWAYWHARVAPVHFLAAHYGALLEAIQRNYINSNDLHAKTKLMSDDEWKHFVSFCSKFIDESCFEDEVKAVIRKRLSNINFAPTSASFDIMCTSLGINFGKEEAKARKQRNTSAHGVIPGSEKYLELLKHNKILMLVAHRLIIKISKGSSYYNDYYSLGFPIRPIGENIPEETE